MLFVLFLPFYRLQHDLSERKRVLVDGLNHAQIGLIQGFNSTFLTRHSRP